MRLDQAIPFGAVIGLMRAAAQICLAQPQIGQPALRHIDMQMRALMAGAGQRDLRVGQPRSLGSPAFQQRQSLDHLAG